MHFTQCITSSNNNPTYVGNEDNVKEKENQDKSADDVHSASETGNNTDSSSSENTQTSKEKQRAKGPNILLGRRREIAELLSTAPQPLQLSRAHNVSPVTPKPQQANTPPTKEGNRPNSANKNKAQQSAGLSLQTLLLFFS